MCRETCELRAVRANKTDIDLLYDLLRQRQYGISHKQVPTYSQHEKFVNHNPYRAWFFIIVNKHAVGSIYLLDSNNIGINVEPEYSVYIASAIEQLVVSYPPLPAIASVRAARYMVNVAPDDQAQAGALKTMGASVIQHTYILGE